MQASSRESLTRLSRSRTYAVHFEDTAIATPTLTPTPAIKRVITRKTETSRRRSAKLREISQNFAAKTFESDVPLISSYAGIACHWNAHCYCLRSTYDIRHTCTAHAASRYAIRDTRFDWRFAKFKQRHLFGEILNFVAPRRSIILDGYITFVIPTTIYYINNSVRVYRHILVWTNVNLYKYIKN